MVLGRMVVVISKTTAEQIVRQLRTWCMLHNVSVAAMVDLFFRIDQLPGNKSFSVAALKRLCEEWEKQV